MRSAGRRWQLGQAALTNCATIDECKGWSEKAEAMRSYARQAKDETHYKTAIRIQARATRRCGELLKQIDGRGDHRRNNGAGTSLNQQTAAEDAGLSKRQQVTAVRLANVPETDFDAAVESDTPPTITALAEQGTNKRFDPPDGFKEATKLIGTVPPFERMP